MSHFDVLVIGAGLSGISAGYHLQTRCPHKTYAILEGRERLGGTWDLFRYPGIRSDSDMYTLGYSFRPWTKPKAIADGPSILAYVRETAEEYGIDRHIRYGRRAVSARWSSRDARWTLDVEDVASGRTLQLTCGFLFVCAGIYEASEGYTPSFAGTERFGGRIIHPQHWPADFDYAGKRIVVIGSGATAVTLIPELAKSAAHVTMLQRSPTYVVSAPEKDPFADWLRERLPPASAYAITRWKNVALTAAVFAYCRRYPAKAKKFLVGLVKRQLGESVDVATHFTPAYDPWDQRMCLAPNGDLFKALRAGRASVVTDHIDTITEKGIRLRSGAELEADLIVTATGLKLKFLGGLALEVDGARIEPAATRVYKGMMCSDVQNLALAIGYTNASWTLKCDLTSEYVCRLLNYMSARGFAQCCPRKDDPSVTDEPLVPFSSGYVQRSLHLFPHQGSAAPWKLHQNYALDRMILRHAPVADRSLVFSPRPS